MIGTPKYANKGFVITGIQTPEFEFEKNLDSVKEAVKGFGIKYPVIQDNNYGTWNAYGNRYWPRDYLVDKVKDILDMIMWVKEDTLKQKI